MRLGTYNAIAIILLAAGAFGTTLMVRDARDRIASLEVCIAAAEADISNGLEALSIDVHAAHRRIDEAARAAHARRAELAGELRREIGAAAAPLRSALDDLSRRLDDESDVRALVCESLYQGIDALRAELGWADDAIEALRARKPEPVRTETVKVVERVVEKPVYVQPVYYYVVPGAVCR
jgi:hypothetical protein